MTRLVCAAVLLLGLGARSAYGLNVSGTVTDSAGIGISGIRVEIYDEGLVFDSLLDVVYADSTGAYLSSAVTSGDHVYALAKWQFQMTPGSDFNNHVVHVVDRGSGNPAVTGGSTLPYVPLSTFDPKRSETFEVTTNFPIPPIVMAQRQPVGVSAMVMRIQQVLAHVRSNTDDWSVDFDVPLHMKMESPSFQRGGELFIYERILENGGTPHDIVTLFHEVGHLVHHHQRGGLPHCDYGDGVESGHTINSEEQPVCALLEGYATYIGQSVAEGNQPAPIMDNFYKGYRDNGVNIPGLVNAPPNGLWRGAEVPPTGLGSAFESGERVEGAVSGFQFEVGDALGFDVVFNAMAVDDVDNVFKFLRTLIQDVTAAGTAEASEIYRFMQTHGIVYNRMQFADEPFDEEEPPDQAPPSEGNRKEIDNKMFLRGKVTTKLEEVANENLGVEDTVDNERVTVGYKRANGGLNDAPSTFTSFTSSSDVGFFSTSIDLDTKSFGGTSGDGEWDLVVRAENEDQFTDNFLPTWNGDGTAAVNTDEKYLKKLGTWYDKDKDPATETEDNGKVIVDNMAPKVENFKPQP